MTAASMCSFSALGHDGARFVLQFFVRRRLRVAANSN
jgi:hypothetical protein